MFIYVTILRNFIMYIIYMYITIPFNIHQPPTPSPLPALDEGL